MKYKVLLAVCVLLTVFLLASCHRYTSFVHFPQKNTEIGCPLYDSIGCLPMNPRDTIMLRERAITGIFKVVEIKKQKWVYRVRVQKDSLIHYRYQSCHDTSYQEMYYYPIYEVFTVKTEKLKGYKKIKKGEKYELIVNPYFEHDIWTDFSVRGVYIKGKHVGIATGMENIYTSPNINGLYYIGPALHKTR